MQTIRGSLRRIVLSPIRTAVAPADSTGTGGSAAACPPPRPDGGTGSDSRPDDRG